MNETEVFVANHCVVNWEIYDLWLKGYTAGEAARLEQNKVNMKLYGAYFEDLLSDVVDHYRVFAGVEEMLKTPPRLSHQLVYQFSSDTIHLLIQKYYSFDASVIREIFGRKLSSRSRKDLDDISDETGVSVKSCRRQFDNVKRVFKTVEELTGRLVDNIQTHFCINQDLAKAYAAIVFITNNRFETGKKKLNYLSFNDFAVCANHMISNWSYSSEDCQNHEDMDVDMDRDFLLDLRELKVLMEREYAEEHRGLMIRALQPVVREKFLSEMDSNFRTEVWKNFPETDARRFQYIRNMESSPSHASETKNVVSKTIISIAYGLNHSKESRDIFIDIHEKLIEPWAQLSWTKTDVQLFLSTFKDTALQLDLFRSLPKLVKVWERYTGTFCLCVLQMYPS